MSGPSSHRQRLPKRYFNRTEPSEGTSQSHIQVDPVAVASNQIILEPGWTLLDTAGTTRRQVRQKMEKVIQSLPTSVQGTPSTY